MKKIILFTFLFLAKAIIAQRVITFDDLVSDNAKEKKALISLKNNRSNPDTVLLTHCIVAGEATDYSTLLGIFDPIIKKGEKDKVKEKSSEAQQKWIQKNIVSSLFTKFNEAATLKSLVQNNFNWSTAAISLAYLCERMGLSYTLQAKPNHLECFLGNTDEKVSINLHTNNTKYQANYVTMLLSCQVIDEEKYSKETLGNLYLEYEGSKTKTVSFSETVADFYFKKTLQSLENKEVKEAVHALEIANFFQKEAWKNDLRGILLTFLIADGKDSDLNSYLPLFELTYYPKFSEKIYTHLGEIFYRLTRKNLITDLDFDKQLKLLSFFRSHLGNQPEIEKDFLVIHYANTVDSYLFQEKKEKAFLYADTLFTLAPRNIQMQSAFTELVLQKVLGPLLVQQHYSKIELYANQLVTRFPFIKENPQVQFVFQYAQALRISNCLEKDKNEACVSEFWQFKAKNFESMRENNVVGTNSAFATLYSSLCAYYFQQSQFTKGNDVLKEGIKLFPDDANLQRKYEAHEEYFDLQDVVVPPPPVKKKKN
jgi:hypothetical protein